jgi:hypothetical protein
MTEKEPAKPIISGPSSGLQSLGVIIGMVWFETLNFLRVVHIA